MFIIPNRKWSIILLLVLLTSGMWLSSGNLTPYSATLEKPYMATYDGVLLDSATEISMINAGEKVYTVNNDHLLYLANFKMLNGEAKEMWLFNIVQRRILYYIFAFPLMKWLGFLSGGFITTVIITLLSIWFSYTYIHREYGSTASLFFILMISTYPGIMYWCGTAFAQVMIVPLTLLLYIKMKIYEDEPTFKNGFWMSLIFGVGFLAYDLASFFIPASFLLICYKKQWKHLPLITLMILPTVLLNMYYTKIGFPLLNDNTTIYKNIFLSYFEMNFATFFVNLKKIPQVFFHNYFDSQFLFFGVLGVVGLLATFFYNKKNISGTGLFLTLSILGIFLFANLAPPYQGWPIKGKWIARIYQPFFVVIIFTILNLLKNNEGRIIPNNLMKLLVIAIFIINGVVVFSPVAGSFKLISVYEKFYRHAAKGSMETNIKKYGARPLGF